MDGAGGALGEEGLRQPVPFAYLNHRSKFGFSDDLHAELGGLVELAPCAFTREEIGCFAADTATDGKISASFTLHGQKGRRYCA